MRKLNLAIKILLISAFGIACIAFQGEIKQSIVSAIERCMYTVIPSLFAMTVFCSVISKCGIFSRLSSILPTSYKISQAFVFSNIGGYPIGAKMLKESVIEGELSPAEAENALCFCYASGPAFSVGIAAQVLFSSTGLGIYAYLTVLAVNLTFYVIYAIKHKCKGKNHYSEISLSSSDIVSSVIDASKTMLTICSMILFFSVIQGIIRGIIPFDKLNYFTPILDVTNIANLNNISFEAVCLYLSFGGICVILQLCAIINGKFKMKKFFASFLIRLPLTYLYARLFAKLAELSAVETSTGIRLSQSKSILPLLCMLAMILIAISQKEKAPE